MYIYLYHPVSLRNTFVTSSCTASKSLPRTKCYSLIEIFPSRHPSLAKLTPCCRAPPKQIFTRSRARRRASYVREERGGGRACESLLRYVRSSTMSACANTPWTFRKIYTIPPPFQKARSFAVAAGKIAYRSSPYVHWLRLPPTRPPPPATARRSRGINKTGDNVNESV